MYTNNRDIIYYGDKIFFLSVEELELLEYDDGYYKFMPDGENAVKWWLRSPHDGDGKAGYVICGDNRTCPERDITDKDIVGVFAGMYMDGKFVEAGDLISFGKKACRKYRIRKYVKVLKAIKKENQKIMFNRIKDALNNTYPNYTAPFLWLHNESKDLIYAELQRIYESGIRAVCLESRTHEEFCRDDWWSDVKFILEECKKKNMNVWILDDKHFPSGYANGIFKEKYKHLQPFGITEVHMDLAGPVKDGSAMADCHLKSKEDKIISAIACKHILDSDKYSEIIDITDGLSNGMVYFDLPEGMWRIVFIIKTQSGISPGLRCYCDMLNGECTDKYIDEVYQPHYDKFADYFGNTFLGFFSDEPAFHNNNYQITNMGVPFTHYPWNDKLSGIISDTAMLAGLWFDIEGVSDKIRYEYMDTVSMEYSQNFSRKIGTWCNRHGIMYIGHVIEDNNIHSMTGEGTAHYFRAMAGQDMSGIDVVLHQIIPGLTQCSNAGDVGYLHMDNEFYHYYLGKLASSFAHIDPKKQGRAMCEIFGAYGWAEGSKIMKYLMDHMLVRGINYFVPHAFSPKENDDDCPPNFYDSGNNPQYKYFKNNMDYLNRMSHILSGGTHISTCAILYDCENRWLNKKFLPLEKAAKVLYDNLYDYDIIPSDYIDKIDNNGMLNGEKYKLLIVPYSSSVAKEVMEKLQNTNIEIVLVSESGNEVSCLPYNQIPLNKLVDYMKGKSLADVSSDYNGIFLRYCHYTNSGAHIYMFSNEDIHNTIDTTVCLSSFDGGKYIEYDAFENNACIKVSKDNKINLKIAPYHSVVIVHGRTDYDGIKSFSSVHYSVQEEIKPIFNISTASKNSDDFIPYKKTDRLFNITGKNEMPEFSGHIKYEAEIMLEKGDYIIDLGYVGEIAEVYLNNRYIGTCQFPPYKFHISSEDTAKKNNSITVIVTNHNGYSKRDPLSRFLLFEPSGLLGPIKIQKAIS